MVHAVSDYQLVCASTLYNKATIHQVTTMLATSKNALISDHNHLLTTGTDDFTRWGSGNNQSVESSVPMVSRCL